MSKRRFSGYIDYVKMFADVSVTSKLEFLANHPVFKGLDEEELRVLSQIAREFEFEPGAVIAYQRDIATEMILVESGRLYGRQVNPQGAVMDTSHYQAGDFYGSEWLFSPGTHPMTIVGTDAGRYLTIDGEAFRQFLVGYPGVIHRLEPEFDEEGTWLTGLPEEAWERAERLPLKERRRSIGPIRLLPDELVEYYTRRSPIVLLLDLVGPVLLLFLGVGAAWLLIPGSNTVLQTFRGIVGVLSLLIFGGLIVFRIFDWRNDYFVITNKHISHREFELRSFRTQLNKVPVNQVQSVTIERPTFLANLFNLGTVRITTASQLGTIRFAGIDNPGEVERVLNNLRRRVRAVDEAAAQSSMRQTVERHFELPSSIRPVEAPDNAPSGEVLLAARDRGIFGRLLRLISWRVEDGLVITYRRNYLILLWEILLPLATMVLLIIAGYLTNRFLIANAGTTIAVMSPLMFLNLLWLIWRYEDWRNDIFQLTDRDVIDIDRQPFGFGESRKQAPLRNIQNVRAERPGFFATLFDYGNVYIETAGAASDITFDRIPRPSQVLSDVFRRLDEYREGQSKKDGELRRGEYAVLLDVYKQELERGRLPRRFPPD